MYTIRVFKKDQLINGGLPPSITDSLRILGQTGRAFVELGLADYEMGNHPNGVEVAQIKNNINQQTAEFKIKGSLNNKLHTILKNSQSVIILAEGHKHQYILLGVGEKLRVLILPEEPRGYNPDHLIYIAQALWPGEEVLCSGDCNWYLDDDTRTISIMLTKDTFFWGTERQKEAASTIVNQITGSRLNDNGIAIIPQSVVPNLPKPAALYL